MKKEDYKYSEITGKIIGCCMEVHTVLGSGFQEVIYQRALQKEMELKGLRFSREHEMPIYYKDNKIGTRRVRSMGGCNRVVEQISGERSRGVVLKKKC